MENSVKLGKPSTKRKAVERKKDLCPCGLHFVWKQRSTNKSIRFFILETTFPLETDKLGKTR